MDKYPPLPPNAPEYTPSGTRLIIERAEEIFQAITENTYENITLAKVSLERPIKTLRNKCLQWISFEFRPNG